ncbi:prepilin peptidase [Pseudoruegeria sp. SHC-113]|uniref:prepilin peptidase n=1 Tax=Pseudoruegeria sp. SHC-113 TaxID=2855439 RepID=UPI0021BBA8D5|nr:prepilin peptidase [Pseudoruegeria sp. SHC-113]MCT8161373.1 prepilin peptidase [Pseudoruegeria sp. SHC-113]
MLEISSFSAWCFLPLATPIGVWVAYNDMKFMKIPNISVMALLAVFMVVGLIALPFDQYLTRLLQGVVVLIAGFIISTLGLVGAGDAKFAAVMAPFVALGDVTRFMILFAMVLLAAFATHRTLRSMSAVRRLADGWASWETRDFPMGLALGASLIFYLLLGALYGA